MRFAIIAVTAVVALAGAANAQTSRLSDRDYVALARCAGLAEGSSVDAASLQQALRSEQRGRADHIRARATDARRAAASEIRTAAGDDAQRLAAERDACRS